ncbi:hypothetical protein DYBT9275_02970 [Dyadobacter sp. CECT 9275]|uniref:Putative restriction endonuclease domain-containing protein n=1 Tax=Dyadobacter helix TaxID=2822344 RepID=A0A916JD58_9BACT|nr:Uma2 family endonuclease [Dyadobacter sp. CECT 9275]CAG5002812.1 hypothetical protein DYBT9275_02970 [Dyadobacter sp. CECT 9275]
MLGNAQTALQEWDLTQIINGKEITSPSPKIYHQKISRKLQRLLEQYVEKHDLGEIYNAPLDVILEENVNRLQPDLIFVSHANRDIIQDWLRGVPDLLVEIVSKSTFQLDTKEKKEIYEKYGVKEYWIVFPEFKKIEVYQLTKNGYILFNAATGTENLKSNMLAGLTFPASIIFE